MVRNMCASLYRELGSDICLKMIKKKNQTTNKHCIHICLEAVQKEAGLELR